MIDKILEYNKEFVREGKAEAFQTSKFPDRKLAIVTCMDTRLVELLPAAYLLSLRGNVNLVWLAYPIAEIASSSLTVFFFLRIYRQKIKPLFEN